MAEHELRYYLIVYTWGDVVVKGSTLITLIKPSECNLNFIVRQTSGTLWMNAIHFWMLDTCWFSGCLSFTSVVMQKQADVYHLKFVAANWEHLSSRTITQLVNNTKNTHKFNGILINSCMWNNFGILTLIYVDLSLYGDVRCIQVLKQRSKTQINEMRKMRPCFYFWFRSCLCILYASEWVTVTDFCPSS